MLVYIKPTEACNLKCLHCYNYNRAGTLDLDRTATFLAQLNEIVFHNYFILHGGEPLLQRTEQIEQFVCRFPKNRWRITTNLVYDLTDTRVRILDKMDEIRTSYDRVIRFPDSESLSKWEHNVREIDKSKLMVNICLTTELICQPPAQLLDYISSLGVNRIHFERLTLTGNALNNRHLVPSYDSVDDWLCDLYQCSKSYNIYNNFFKDIELGLHHTPANCRAKTCQLNTITINSDGTIGSCPNDSNTKYFATLDTSPLEVVNRKLSTKCTVNTKCLVCELYSVCRGECCQLPWQGQRCPYPKNLSKMIEKDLRDASSTTL